MRNLKKLVALIVTIAMVAMLAIPAFAAPADVVGTDYEGAVTRLMALGIITGYPDGSFGPNDTITRAQFAAVIIRALGHEDIAKTAAATAKFSDVPSNHWAAGYIGLAVSLGIVKGYTDGRYGVNDPVTYDQAIAMIIRALGAGEKAENEGGYPIGYMLLAKKLGITNGVPGEAGVGAPRGIVALLLDNSLTVTFFEKVGDSTWKQPDEDKENFLTALNMNLHVEGVIVTETPASAGLDENEFVAGGETYTAVDGAFDVESLLGKKVDLWGTSEDAVVLAENVVGEELSVASLVYDEEDEVYTVTLADGTKADYTVAEGAGALLNLVIESGADAVEALDGVNADQVEITLTVNGDKEIQFVDAILYDTIATFSGIIENKVAKKTKIDIDGAADILIVDGDTVKNVVVVKNGEAAELEDLEAGDVLFIGESGNNVIIKATDETVAGTLEAVKDAWDSAEKIRVEGKWYDISSFFSSADVEELKGAEVTVTLDPAGKFYDIELETAASSPDKYGIILAYQFIEGNLVTDDVYKIKVLTSTGDVVVYSVDGDVPALALGNAGLANKLATYTLDADGIVDSITLAPATPDVTGAFNKTRGTFDGIEYSSDVVIFYNGDVVALADVEDGSTANTAVDMIVNGDDVILAMVMSAIDTTVTTDPAYAYVTDVVQTADGYTATVINLDGEDQEFDATEGTAPEIGKLITYKLEAGKLIDVDDDLTAVTPEGDEDEFEDEIDAVTKTSITVDGEKFWFADDVLVIDAVNGAALTISDLYKDMVVEVYLSNGATGDVVAIIVTEL